MNDRTPCIYKIKGVRSNWFGLPLEDPQHGMEIMTEQELDDFCHARGQMSPGDFRRSREAMLDWHRRFLYQEAEMGDEDAEGVGTGEIGVHMTQTVTVPLDLLHDLWKYGILAPVEGVLYGKSHRDRLMEADRIIAQAHEIKTVYPIIDDGALNLSPHPHKHDKEDESDSRMGKPAKPLVGG